MSYRPGLPHMAYFRSLADAASEQSAEWRATLAGLVAMRLIDVWATDEPLPEPGLRAFERSIDMMYVDAIERTHLQSLNQAFLEEVDGRKKGGAKDESRVLECTREYAEALWCTAEWRLASDVCRTIIRHARTTSEATLVPLVYNRLGHCLLAQGRQDSALEAFQAGRSFATARGDARGDLHLRISEASVERVRGNYIAAECILDEVIAEATFAEVPGVRALAVHDRGVIAFQRGDDARALALYLQALREYGTTTGAERVLADIALALLKWGYRGLARDVLEILEQESIEQMQRWTATLNLMFIAVQDGHELAFDHHWRSLARTRLPARQRGYYHVCAAQGWFKFDQPTLARRELARAVEIVHRSHIAELDQDIAVLQAQSTKTKRANRQAPTPEAPASTPPDLRLLIDRTPAAAQAWQRSRRAARAAAIA